ncbi:TIGR03621 family F420-dependent LLM class oxidoreductase [Bailinhaonella thermotolerans]|uniref:TIGR03621 family F420-dependent LLM class oxidoreductase n=1 Tax=Bailinhaonella thermotolerans TaxID=1070861 RepID=A0A3A4AT60_9ACTN|nr:TIGR03621 family F420-dependent LLM class oxidoreductase [Bailinhaonella thermotolerans]RJL32543.1 TIGR03621 family F420-dependent LLM class oxidoreductase [Bailinhaonella thermotolerans]
MRDFRFGVVLGSLESSGQELVRRAREAEEAGFDVVLVPDQVGEPAPFSTLAAIAGATRRLRVGTYTLNVSFWKPALLAREVATLDRLSGGRFELGLGIGRAEHEFDAAEVAWEPAAGRAARLATTVERLDQHFADRRFSPSPAQEPRPPLLIPGDEDELLPVAAGHADVVAFTGTRQIPGREPGVVRLTTAEEADERVRAARAAAGGRDFETSCLVQAVFPIDDRRLGATTLMREMGLEFSVPEVLETPYLLIGTIKEMATQLVERRERYGFSYICVHEPNLDFLAQVIAALR